MRGLILLLLISTVLSIHFTQTIFVSPTYLETFRKAELAKHNQYRRKHGCPPLVLNSTLNAAAQAHAQKMGKEQSLSRSLGSINRTYGENLYYGYVNSPTVPYKLGDASKTWYSEEQYYDYDTFKSKQVDKAVGHFTNMIWKSSTQLGLGYVRVNDTHLAPHSRAVYIVANYAPTPNVNGQYAANVPKPITFANLD